VLHGHEHRLLIMYWVGAWRRPLSAELEPEIGDDGWVPVQLVDTRCARRPCRS